MTTGLLRRGRRWRADGPFHLIFGGSPLPTLTYTLQRDCLDNVDDAAIRRQIDGPGVRERQGRSQLLKREADELRDEGAEHA